MSITALRWAYQQSVLNASVKAVLVSLAEQAKEDSLTCFPSQSYTAERTQLSERTVRDALAWLAEHGLIRRARRYGGVRKRDSDLYTLLIPADGSTGKKRHLPAATAGTSGSTGKSASDLPANGSISTGSGCRVTRREPEEEPSTGVAATNAATRAEPKTPTSTGHRLPEDWLPTEGDIAWQREQGVSDETARYETDKFKDHFCAKPGASGRKLDWSRAWKNWIRKAAEWSPAAPEPVSSERRPQW